MSAQQGKCSDWKAWHDRQPVGPATLHVTGKCVLPTGGFKVELRPMKRQGINPRILLLEKIVHPPTGPANDIVTTVDVHYTEKTDAHYDQVTIIPDGVTIPVKEVS